MNLVFSSFYLTINALPSVIICYNRRHHRKKNARAREMLLFPAFPASGSPRVLYFPAVTLPLTQSSLGQIENLIIVALLNFLLLKS